MSISLALLGLCLGQEVCALAHRDISLSSATATLAITIHPFNRHALFWVMYVWENKTDTVLDSIEAHYPVEEDGLMYRVTGKKEKKKRFS